MVSYGLTDTDGRRNDVKKGDRVLVRAVFKEQVTHKYPTKLRQYMRRAFELLKPGWFLGWSMRYTGRIEWEGDEIGYAFYRDVQHKVAIVALDDGVVAFRRPVAVLPEDLFGGHVEETT